MTVRFYSSVAAETTLQNTATPAATTIVVVATTGFPALTPFTLALDYEGATEELVQVDAVAGTSLTVVRAIDGTSATTHNAGARVRHVSSARDFADSRAHENASANVHGLAPGSALVGTTDTQTLTNKTLTSPIINSPTIAGGSSTGTISGAATYTGNRTFSGEIIHSNLYRGSRATTGDSQWETRVTGDANARFFVRADGAHRFGPGTTLADSTFERTGNRQFRSDAAVRVERSNSFDPGFQFRQTGDAFDSVVISKDGIDIGPGNTSFDNRITRFDVGLLGTVDRWTASNFPAGAWNSWTPTWGTTTGANIPSFGNATVEARYQVLGATMHYMVYIAFGNTTNFGGGGTGDNWTFSMPSGLTVTDSSTPFALGFGRITQNSANTCPVVVRTAGSNSLLQLDTTGGKQDGNALTNAGVVDAVTPWTWANGNVLQFSGTLQIDV